MKNRYIRLIDVLRFVNLTMSPWSSRSVGLLRRKAKVRAPGQTPKQNTKSISLVISYQQISGKNSESK